MFDTGYKACGFEDADYSMRCIRDGISTEFLDLPFMHHDGKTRWKLPGYKEIRQQNIDYFYKKWKWRPDTDKMIEVNK